MICIMTFTTTPRMLCVLSLLSLNTIGTNDHTKESLAKRSGSCIKETAKFKSPIVSNLSLRTQSLNVAKAHFLVSLFRMYSFATDFKSRFICYILVVMQYHQMI